jgi:phosphatidylserine decarboxylase
MVSPSRVAATSLRALPRKGLSRMLGRIARVEAPEAVLRRAMDVYCRAYDVDLSECEVPQQGFETFDAFFTRRLKPGARAADPDPDALLSPADGRLEDLGSIDSGATFLVKGRPYGVAELLGDDEAAARFQGGQFAIIYLSPRDYHRVHAPVSGRVASIRYVAGTLFPVNQIGLRHIPKLFARNERVAVEQHSERHGTVVSVMVGAIGVGRISLSFDDTVITNAGRDAGQRSYGHAGPHLERAAELGTFHLGSTVVVFVPRTVPLVFERSAGDRVRVGEAIGRKRAA